MKRPQSLKPVRLGLLKYTEETIHTAGPIKALVIELTIGDIELMDILSYILPHPEREGACNRALGTI